MTLYEDHHKKHLFLIAACFLIVSVFLISCKEPDGSGGGDPKIAVVDISQYTNWDYMVVGEDKSSFFLI